MPAQQDGWIRLRQNLLCESDNLPGAFDLIAIILAGSKNRDLRCRARFFGQGSSSRDRMGNAENLFRFLYFTEKGKTDFLAVPGPSAFRHHVFALFSKLTTAGNRPVGSIQ